ncbi:MAG: cell wall hydrolase [Sphingomonadaceae bacterium]|nr:cell wall hydrolase [Sphingomonadaceae bacterium]
MSRLFRTASAAAICATIATAVILTVPGAAQEVSSALQDANQPGDVIFEPAPATALPIPQNQDADAAVSAPTADEDVDSPRGDTLRETVALADASVDDAEHRCLATAIYYEARAESLEGQLAVANVVMNRAESGRFAPSICGVLRQRSQFSFVRGGVIPTPPENAQWRTAVAVASVAMDDSWASPVPGALYFHAARVSPGWNRPRLARLGNHIFYR